MAQLPPGGTGFDLGDPVVWAKIIPGGQDHSVNSRDGSKSYRETWQVYVSTPNTSPAAVRASKRVPADGFFLYKHVPATDPFLLGTYMRADGVDPIDNNVAVVTRDVRQSGDPYFFEVVIYYEGTDDPTTETPEVSSDEVPYQEHLMADVNGKPVMNSALDPIDGGMPSEGFFKKVVITRNLPYTAWHMKKGDNYRKTINRSEFVYSQQFELDGVTPIKEQPGAVLIDSIREQRLQRAKVVGGTAADKFYWRVTVELLIDLQAVRLADGTKTSRLHRWVVPDAGYHAFKDAGGGKMRKQAIRTDPAGSSSPQLLNGKGEALIPRSTQIDPIEFNAYVQTSAFGGLCPDFYACPGGGAFAVADALGVLANDTDPLVTSVVAVDNPTHSSSFTLNSSGGFTYTPAAGFVGWDKFTYKPTGGLDDAKQTCQIFVGAVPVLLFFDRYRFSNWSDIAVLLEGW